MVIDEYYFKMKMFQFKDKILLKKSIEHIDFNLPVKCLLCVLSGIFKNLPYVAFFFNS